MERDNVSRVEINVHDGGQINFVKDNGSINAIQNNTNEDVVYQYKIKSRTQEYADKWNQNMFLNDFDKRDENAGVNVKLSEVYLKPNYIWKKNYMHSTDLDSLLSEFIDNNMGNQMLLILGQPGIGKSTLITWITTKFVTNIDKILIYRFANDLIKIEWKNLDKKYEIVSEMLKKLNLSYESLCGKTLIIDGFDEVNIGIERTNVLNNLYRDLIESSFINNFSLIITCRENYIQDLNKLKCDYITLQPWDNSQIQNFCNIYRKKTRISISKKTINVMLEAGSILGIPLILYMILSLDISIDENGSIVDVYDQIFSLDGGIYDRCIENDRYEASHRIAGIKGQIHQISKEIAIWMFENNYNEAFIPQVEYKKICDQVTKEQNQNIKDIEEDFLISSFLKFSKQYEGYESGEIYFIHRSIYEYFIVENIYDLVMDAVNVSKEKLAGVCGIILKGNLLSKDMLAFFQRKIEKSELKEKFDVFNDTFQLMLSDGMTYYTNKCLKNVIMCEMNVFYNMLELMHLWGRRLKFYDSITKYLNWGLTSSFNLENADLIGVNLSGLNFSNVNVLGVNILQKDIE